MTSTSRRDRLKREFFYFACANPTISDSVFSFSCPATIICFSKTCRDAYDAVVAYTRLMYDVNRHLSRYFDNPVQFRRLQQRTGMLVSGSNALTFMGNMDAFSGSDLDLYVDVWNAMEAGEWLEQNGYVYRPKQTFWAGIPGGPLMPNSFTTAWNARMHWNRPDPGLLFPSQLHATWPYECQYEMAPGIYHVFDFFKSERADSEVDHERKVQLIVAKECPLAIILRFHSTCVMNFITHSKAVSLYPLATFSRKCALSIGNAGFGREVGRSKWESRGWTMVHATQERWADVLFRAGKRYVGDRSSWTLPLDTTGLDPEAAEDVDLLSINSWWLQRPRTEEAKVLLNTITTPVLRWSYVLSAQENFFLDMQNIVTAREKEAARVTGNMWTIERTRDESFDIEIARSCKAHRDYGQLLDCTSSNRVLY